MAVVQVARSEHEIDAALQGAAPPDGARDPAGCCWSRSPAASSWPAGRSGRSTASPARPSGSAPRICRAGSASAAATTRSAGWPRHSTGCSTGSSGLPAPAAVHRRRLARAAHAAGADGQPGRVALERARAADEYRRVSRACTRTRARMSQLRRRAADARPRRRRAGGRRPRAARPRRAGAATSSRRWRRWPAPRGVELRDRRRSAGRRRRRPDPSDASCCVNLVDNAIKYTPGGGRVVCRPAARASGRDRAVADTGVGIARRAPAARLRALLPGRPRARARTVGRRWLGLAICQWIVQVARRRDRGGQPAQPRARP